MPEQFKIFFKKNTASVLGVLIVGLSIFVSVSIYFSNVSSQENNAIFDPESELVQQIETDRSLFEALRNNVDSLMAKGGIEGTMDMLRIAKVRNLITMSECHTVLHLVGHEAYHYYEYDLEKIVSEDLTLCGGAYYHGVAAEIVVVEQNMQDIADQLDRFCELTKMPGECYHGAGHEFMATSLDIKGSLAQCDFLSRKPGIDLLECHKGVFSEAAFRIAGIDGDTGLRIPGEPQVSLGDISPLEYCQNLSETYQDACSLQLSRILLDESNRHDALEHCASSEYSKNIQLGCVRVVAANIAQADFDNNGGGSRRLYCPYL